MGNNHQYSELREKLIASTKLAPQRLVEKILMIIFSENGKVVKVKARSIK